MKKSIAIKGIILLLLATCIVFLLLDCSKEKTEITDYQYMYDGIVKVWNRHAASGEKRDSLLGFGEYLYNSQLILFPRETPTTLEEYYFHWSAGIDVDEFAIYFTCKLEEYDYSAFVSGLENFEVVNESKSQKMLYDTEHFSLPTFVLQWEKAEEKWEVLEYIMLDKVNHRVVFVYTMGDLASIEQHSSYMVTPSEMHFLEDDFSIYENFENCTYDISFLNYLN